MAASNKTVKDVAAILVEELGKAQALHVMSRLTDETSGNASYKATVRAVYDAVFFWKD